MPVMWNIGTTSSDTNSALTWPPDATSHRVVHQRPVRVHAALGHGRGARGVGQQHHVVALGRMAHRSSVSGPLGSVHLVGAEGNEQAVARVLQHPPAMLVDDLGEARERDIHHHRVTNGCSELIVEVFGADIGSHARSAFGVAQIPLGACVAIELIAELV